MKLKKQQYSKVSTGDEDENSFHHNGDRPVVVVISEDGDEGGNGDDSSFLAVDDGRSNGSGSDGESCGDGDNSISSDDEESSAFVDPYSPSALPTGVVLCIGLMLVSASAAALLTTLIMQMSSSSSPGRGRGGPLVGGFQFGSGKKHSNTDDDSPVIPWPRQFPADLLNKSTGAYDSNGRDFVNTDGNTPPFWANVRDGKNDEHWGPCLPPKPSFQGEETSLDWRSIVHWNHKRTSDSGIEYPHDDFPQESPPWGMCRPGFIIIGAGKCGTSSLYHYITGHDRVLPASEKQIHYFKYYPTKSMSWYLKHFPTTQAFLGSGALMTGEASPGYLPYPDVVALAQKRLPGPKIILAARDPLDRAWSSYRYNYVVPALDLAMKGRLREKSIPKGMSEDYYRENHLFSFEDMLKAELKVLRECFEPGGRGELKAKERFGKMSWAIDEFQRRKEEGLPPLIDLDDHCYGDKVKHLVPRRQWADLIEANPDKIINLPNLHLVQSFIGRSLYTLPLEWWYIAYPAEDIYLVCNEEMRDNTAGMLNHLTSWLGLPEFDFSEVVAQGMFNVGGNRGYDLATPWEEVEQEAAAGENAEIEDEMKQKLDEHDLLEEREENIPISDELRQELLDFVRPFNERLFQLTGQRCSWL